MFLGNALSFLVGVLLTMLVLASTGIVAQFHELKQECEKNLPRNQVCVMKLVPQGE